jgi:hypothetical protein
MKQMICTNKTLNAVGSSERKIETNNFSMYEEHNGLLGIASSCTVASHV